MSERIWVKRYPEGIPADISDKRPDNLIQLLETSFKNFGSKEAFENMGKSLTYHEVDQQSDFFAAYLQNKLGMKKGDRIAIQMPNCLQYPIVLIGALKAGCVVVNTNPLYTHREMEHQFSDAQVKAVVIVANFAHSLEEALKKIKVEHIIITELGDMLGGFKGTLVNLVVKHVKKMVPAYSIPQALAFKKVLKEGARMKYTKVDISGADTAFLQYTGGTTGVSKGATLSHDNVVAHTLIINEWFRPLLRKGQTEVMITAIPLYHIFALNVNGTFMMYIGAKNVLITNPRDMPGFIKELKKHSFTLFTGVNTLFNGLLNQPNVKEVDWSHLKGAIGGGMAVQDFVARKWKETTGSDLVEGYGLSETSPVASCNPLDGTHKMGTIGLPLPSTQLAIFTDEGQQLAQGEIGEICIKGPQVMSGYWNQSNEGVFFDGGWFRTGDIGLMDEEGFFKIVDRKKDMINVSGFNVYPNEVENVIVDHPKVLEVAVIGVPDARSTECVKAFVVKSDASLTEEELRTYCEEELTGYKKPKYIEFVDELPKSNVGKILRRKLKEMEEERSKAG
ncbi:MULTISPECIES: AMP-binding protein [Roseivirga]|jgi:long-chain acyl-CoA synthetase|uniref:AMP-binding protein n=1 Tax=Roseivirga TaxID=290180 RepID=UPI00257FEE06|nr:MULTISPECIES: AMP-binding protein [Roseivirga]|tara:strand:+ start:26578 stop:28263 length:1686 start_codon:yes stop_codon:yes gene_type:complete